MREEGDFSSSLDDVKNSLKMDDKAIHELFKTYLEHTLKEYKFESLIIHESDKKVFMKLFNEGAISDYNKEDFFLLLDIIVFTQILIEAKETNYQDKKSKKRKLQSKINTLEESYIILNELELLGVQNSTLETIKKAKSELSKVMLDLVCIKDEVIEIRRDHRLFLDYESKTFQNISNNHVVELAPYYKDKKNDNDIIKVLSDDYKTFKQILENSTVIKEDILRLSSIVFMKSLENRTALGIPYKDKINFLYEVYNYFFNASKSLIDNRVGKLKYHSIKVDFTNKIFMPIELRTEPSATTQSITLMH